MLNIRHGWGFNPQFEFFLRDSDPYRVLSKWLTGLQCSGSPMQSWLIQAHASSFNYKFDPHGFINGWRNGGFWPVRLPLSQGGRVQQL